MHLRSINQLFGKEIRWNGGSRGNNMLKFVLRKCQAGSQMFCCLDFKFSKFQQKGLKSPEGFLISSSDGWAKSPHHAWDEPANVKQRHLDSFRSMDKLHSPVKMHVKRHSRQLSYNETPIV